jgi:hypothetical protein
MPVFDSHTRDQLRQAYSDAWRKHREHAPLTPLETMITDLAVREQVSIDRPPGVRGLLQSLQSRLGDWHSAEHALMEALAETLWQAQRAGTPPDEGRYLTLARRRLER